MFFYYFYDEMTEERSKGIKEVIDKMMNLVLDNVLQKKPFIPEVFKQNKPLYAALVPYEIWKGSFFERKFVTDFGKAWQHLAVVAAKEYHRDAHEEYMIRGTINEERLTRIQRTINKIEHKDENGNRTAPNWEREIKYFLAGEGKPVDVSVQCDLYIETNNGKKYAFEIKAPQPNSDQTKVSKEKILKLFAMNEQPVDYAYFSLAYNPFGKSKKDYKWSFADRWFNMQKDPCVLIGDETWNFIGGEGTYQGFIKEINKLGVEYKERIYREYLRMDPPEGFEEDNR